MPRPRVKRPEAPWSHPSFSSLSMCNFWMAYLAMDIYNYGDDPILMTCRTDMYNYGCDLEFTNTNKMYFNVDKICSVRARPQLRQILSRRSVKVVV